MDFLLQRFLEQEYDRLQGKEQQVFEQFLNESDPDIYAWITGVSLPEHQAYHSLIRQLQAIHMAGNQQA